MHFYHYTKSNIVYNLILILMFDHISIRTQRSFIYKHINILILL